MLKEISFLLLTTLVCSVWTYTSFADYPLKVSSGDYMVHATLTDLSSSKKYYLQEYIYSNFYINGKISISSSDFLSPIDVHYGSSSEYQRLVIQGYDCNFFNYKTGWDKKLPGITKSLLNHILLVGPSLIYRLKEKSFAWKTGENVEIRGTTMKSVYIKIGADLLTITVYYKDTLTLEDGLSQPSRIQFTGSDPSDESSIVKQDLILDIYLQTKTDHQGLDKVVIPKPGIGCSVYFSLATSNSARYLNLAKNSVHFFSTETINGPKKSMTRNEIFIDEIAQISNIKTTSEGKTTVAIYDYTLGIVYEQRDGVCSTFPMGLKSFLARVDGPYETLQIDAQFFSASDRKYLGQTWFENRPGFNVDVWESVVYNDGQNDKVVTTIYTVDSAEKDTTFGFIPVGKSVNAYKKGSTGYSLIQTTTTEYYDFRQKITKEEYDAQFRIDDCYSEPADRKTLALQFDCKSEDCDYAVKKYAYDFQDKVRNAILNIGTISGSRIGNIDIVLGSNTTTAYVTFLNFPPLKSAFKLSYTRLSSEVFKLQARTQTRSAEDCLQQNANMVSNFEAVVYSGDDQACYRISKIKSLIEDNNGKYYTVYEIPLRNLYRYNHEAPMDKIQDELKGRGLGFYFYDGDQLVQYSVIRVEEVIEPESKSRQLFIIEDRNLKFMEDGTNTIIATKASNIGECYRACEHLEENDCETFSFCQSADKVECLLSTSVYANVTDKRISALGCQIYRKNFLSDYMKINNREFINPISIATDHWVDECAELCSKSDECFSFQTSNNAKCIFGGYYTDSLMRYSQDADIYIPKLALKFAPTGHKIVTETLHTELSLTFDQCAALCYDMGSSDGDCKSFNFCPKSITGSSCSLSKYSVKDSLTKTVYSTDCTNFELIPKSDQNKNKKNENSPKSTVKNGTSATGAFGLIVLFIAVGLVVGVVGPFIYNRSRKLVTSSERDNVNWKRHQNEDVEHEQSTI